MGNTIKEPYWELRGSAGSPLGYADGVRNADCLWIGWSILPYNMCRFEVGPLSHSPFSWLARPQTEKTGWGLRARCLTQLESGERSRAISGLRLATLDAKYYVYLF